MSGLATLRLIATVFATITITMTTQAAVSEAKYKVRIIPDVRVPMRDGVELAVKITRPDAEGRFPGIMEYNPYRRIAKPLPDYNDEYPPPVPYLAERGYVIVQFDVRGTGNSGGHSTDIYSDEERQDAYEMVEWIARQPWCTGKVGMLGKSYSAVVQWQVAVQNPPALKAIVVRSANHDVYTDWTNPGGAIRPYMFESYGPLMTAYNFAPPDIDIVGAKWSEIWRERLDESAPWSIGYIENILHGPYWQRRSLQPGYDRVKCAVFVVGGWADWYATPLLKAFSNLNVPKKAWVGPWGHYYPEEKLALPGPRVDGRYEYLKWFDYWLKDLDTGVMDEPPVTLFIRKYKEPAPIYLEENGFWRNESTWPLARANNTPMYFQPDGELGTEAPEEASDTYDSYEYHPAVGIAAGRHGRGNITPWAMPLDQRIDEAYSLSYTTAPLEEDTEVTGEPEATLYVSSSADTAYFAVKLCDVAPDGASKLVTDGGLLATHRDSHTDPKALDPGRVYELKFELKSTAYIFEKGHRIRVNVTSSDFQNAWPAGKPAVNAVYRGARQSSHLTLPIVPEQNPKLPAPGFKPSPHPEPKLEDVPRPEHTVTQDLVNLTTTSSFNSPSGTPVRGINRSSFTVSHRDPAEAVIRSSYEFPVPLLNSEVNVSAQSTLASDKAAYHHMVEVDITVNGMRHFNKSWSVTVPRKLN